MVQAKVRARTGLIIVRTAQEARAGRYLFEMAASIRPQYETRYYDVARGFTDLAGRQLMGDRGVEDVREAFTVIRENRSRCVWVMFDLIPYLKEPFWINQRALRNLINDLPKLPSDRAQTIIIVTANPDIPPEIASDAQVVDWPMPDRFEMGKILDDACEPLLNSEAVDPETGEARITADMKAAIRASISGEARTAAIDASIGLTENEAASCFATSLVLKQVIDPAMVAQEKKQVIASNPALEWIEGPGGFECVGGHENTKLFLKRLEMAWSDAAREYNLPTPLGILLIGISGCGKSLIVKCTGIEWGVPVIRLDLGALKSKFVGDSEQNLRKAFSVIEALGRCIVWWDEIEKALQGATSGSADGGVSADMLGAVLTWMQERNGQAFVMATANDASALPPEFMRKGRFDEIFWVDLPNETERVAVARAALRERKRDADAMADMDLDEIASATNTFTGAEIAALVRDGMYTAFADGQREITTKDLLMAARDVVPLAKTKDKEIRDLREEWAGRAKPATRTEQVLTMTRSVASQSRQLDL